MKKYSLGIIALIFLVITSHAEKVEISGTYQIQVACYDTYHEEVAMVLVPGKDKFSAKRHVLKLTPEMKKNLRLGQVVTVKGKKQKFRKKRMTKGQVRKAMFDCLKDGKGLPYQCAEMSEIIDKIKVDRKANAGAGKQAAAAGAHDHGELEIKPVADDHEVVEVSMIEHIEVTQIEAKK